MHDSTEAELGKPALYAMAAACGIAVANIYYNQPLLGIIEDEFGRQTATGMIPTATQMGYALGLFLLVPLGDLLHRRRLIITQFILLAVALTVAAIAPTAWALVAASLAVGAAATVAQQIVPYAAALTPPEKRGATIGIVMAGLLSGILLSRTLSGFVGEHTGWRQMFWIGVPMALGAAGMMAAVLPDHAPVSRMRYRSAMVSLVHLWQHQPVLRGAVFVQAALFAGFSAFWTILALYLESPRFNLGADIAGLFGIAGAVGIFAAPLAGRIADRTGPHMVVMLGTVLALASWLLFGLWGSLAALVIGVIVLDFGMQGALISHQHMVYALDPAARSRLNTIFMTGMFLGGATGSALAMLAWTHGGWPLVSAFGVGSSLVAIAVRVIYRRRTA